jgi:hypothetical protein
MISTFVQTLLPLDFPAKISALPESKRDMMESEACCFMKSSVSLGSFDLGSSYLKMLEIYCLTKTGRRSKKPSFKLPKQGTMRNGQLFQHQIWEPATVESESGLLPTPVAQTCQGGAKGLDGGSGARQMLADAGSPRAAGAPTLLPTPVARDHFPAHSREYIAKKKAEGHGMANLNDYVAHFLPTPTTRDYKDSGPNVNYQKAAEKSRLPGAVVVQCSAQNGGGTYLNPSFVEEMMGYPTGWTDLNS